MPGKDDNDSLTDIPSMVPESDELAARRPQQPAPRKPVSDRRGGGGGFLWWSLVLVMLAGLIGLGILLKQTNDQLKQEQAQLDEYQQRIVVLENKLSITDASVSTSSTALQSKLVDLDHEVRKLWDNVWKRSKKELAEHGARIDRLNVAEGNQRTVLKALNSKIGETQLSVKVLSDQFDAVGDIPKQLKVLSRQLKSARGDLANLKASQAKFGKRVNDVEGWVASFNAYRRQVNEKLLNLQNGTTPPAQPQQ